ncbi:MAG: hypothetical protein J6D10_00535 [Clostridia bacterium]|nr:hypothetical protein [Clostridia bacterium]
MIRVFDEAGNEVNPTYPKRARGLVKQGRARWADDADDVIVLTSDIRNTEAAYPSEVHKVHTLEDTEMFEYNVNEEIIETAEETETIEETGLPLNEELNRLYGILENIDKMAMNVSCMGLSLPEDMNGMDNEGVQAVADAIMSESTRLRLLAEQYTAMRKQTIDLIDKVKYYARPKPKSDGFDEEDLIVEQINMSMASYKTMCQYLNDQLRCSRIGMDEYRAEMEKVQSVFDYRMDQLRGALNALKQGE